MKKHALLFLWLCGCGSSELKLQQFRLIPGTTGFTVRGPDGGVLLESAQLGGAYAPVAARQVKARFESQYGSYRITEGIADWSVGQTLQWNGAVASVRDGAGQQIATLEVAAPSEGVLKLTAHATTAGANRVSLAFKCRAEDHFLGFGAQSDALDHRGHTVPIFTSEPGIGKTDTDGPPDLWFLVGARHASSYGLPSFLSNRGYLAVLEHDGRSVFELCSVQTDAFRIEAWSDTWTLWLYFGETPVRALERATAGLLGRPMRPPPVAFAPWNDAIFGSANVQAIAKSLRDNAIPSSVVWTEDFRGGEEVSGGGYRIKEEWTIDRTLYPGAEALAAQLRSQGFSWHAYFNTFLVDGTGAASEAKQLGHLVKDATLGPYLFTGSTFKPTGLVDLSRPESREWMKGYMRQALDLGFDGWMADFGEWLPPDAVLASGEEPLAAHQRYPLEWMKLNSEVLAERTDGRQRLFFARSGWLGSTAFTPVVWAGDQRTSFQRDDGLFTVLPMGLNLGLGGVSTYGHDIGGYQSATNPPSTKELFFRWTTLGALSPVMRTHHGTLPRDDWRWDKDAETIAMFRRWSSLHIRLFPYFDGASKDAEERGLPLMRALPLLAPDDAAGWTVSDEYGLGPALLVAPVVDEGALKRTVHFPPGRWVALDGSAAHDGPADLEVDAALAELPVFARAGSVVPLLPDTVQTLLPADPPVVDYDEVKNARVLWVYAGGSSQFVERDGTTYTLTADASLKGVALPACATGSQRGCVDGKTVRLVGQGPLVFDGHRLEVSGPERTLDVVIFP